MLCEKEERVSQGIGHGLMPSEQDRQALIPDLADGLLAVPVAELMLKQH